MTVDFKNDESIHINIRKRRRRLAQKRRRAASLKVRSQVLIGIICLLTMMTGCLAVYGGSGIDSEPQSMISEPIEPIVEYQTITIRGGDTLWSIASAFSDSSQDVRELVREIRALNDVDPGSIYPGQKIKVPIL